MEIEKFGVPCKQCNLRPEIMCETSVFSLAKVSVFKYLYKRNKKQVTAKNKLTKKERKKHTDSFFLNSTHKRSITQFSHYRR